MGINDYDTFTGLTPLQQAALDGSTEKVVSLIDEGADLNQQANGDVRAYPPFFEPSQYMFTIPTFDPPTRTNQGSRDALSLTFRYIFRVFPSCLSMPERLQR